MPKETKTWKRKCPKCKKEHNYCNKQTLDRAIRLNAKCVLCSKDSIRKPKYEYYPETRRCPKCNKIQKYKKKYTYLIALERNTICLSCKNKERSTSSIINCLICNKEFFIENYEKSFRKTCSRICQGKYKSSQFDIYGTFKCDHCGEQYKREKYRDRGKHRFCSTKCNALYNIQKIFEKGSNKKSDTLPELAFELLLIKNNIDYKKQFKVKYIKGKVPYKFYDFHILKTNILIEIDGMYWHGKNLKINELNNQQKNTRINDIIKTKLARDSGYSLYRIWEDEIHLFDLDKLKKYA